MSEPKKMSEPKTTAASVRDWMVEHQISAVAGLWASGITGSIAYYWSRPDMPTNLKVIHARLNAQALTLVALVGAAAVEWYDPKSGTKRQRVAKFLEQDPHRRD